MSPRRYEQRRRAESAEETKRRILDAARERLREAPTESLSLDAVAQAAGVARSTIYLVFGSRAGLFQALFADLLLRNEYQRLIQAVAHPDARHHLRNGVRAGLEMFIADRDLIRTLLSMSHLDPAAVGGAVEWWEAERAGGIEYLARRLGEQGHLRPDITVEEAADVLWVLTSFDSFDLLYTGRGLPSEVVVEVLASAAERAVMKRPRPAGVRSRQLNEALTSRRPQAPLREGPAGSADG
jgi:AcrR family transcriptional regulator